MAKKNNFKYTNFRKKLDYFFQAILILTLITGINILSSKYYKRIDFNKNHRYSLSPETVAYIQQIDKPINIIVMLSKHRNVSDQILTDIKGILKEFHYIGKDGDKYKINIEYVDVVQQRKRAEELAQQYKIPFEDIIIISCGEKQQLLLDSELYQTKDGEIVGFKAEQSILSAILNVCLDTKPKVGFLVGHGEMKLDSVDPIRGLSLVLEILRQRNILVENMDLNTIPEIPLDLDILVIAGPQVPLLPSEVEKIRRYLNEKHGKVIVFLEPAKEHGLDDLLFEWGIRSEDMIILDTGEDYQSNSNDLILRRFAQHPITQLLIDYQLGLLTGLTRPVEVDAGSPIDEKRASQLLITSSETSWAEADYRKMKNLQYNPNIDLAGPVGIAVVSEQTVGSQLGIKIPTGRIVVFGNSDIISNNRISLMGNGILFLNTINWSLDKQNFLNIPPRKMEYMQLTISREDMWGLLFYVFAPSLFLLLAGVVVYFVRNRS